MKFFNPIQWHDFSVASKFAIKWNTNGDIITNIYIYQQMSQSTHLPIHKDKLYTIYDTRGGLLNMLIDPISKLITIAILQIT